MLPPEAIYHIASEPEAVIREKRDLLVAQTTGKMRGTRLSHSRGKRSTP